MYLNNVFIKHKNQTGLGLPAAIFIITIMSLIAVAVNRINESTSQSFSQNVLSARAFYAAESGAQLRTQAALSGPTCSCGSDVTYQFTVVGLASCQATTVCTSFIANTETYCTILSAGSCDGGNGVREIEVRIK